MHYHAEIYIENKNNVKEQVEAIMAPYNENDSSIQETWWDGWQIGGRWTGCHTPDYDPEKDPRNHEICDLCRGTGFRNDTLGHDRREADPSYTCNGCGQFNRETGKWEHGPLGPGVKVKWPTSWAVYDYDVIEVERLPDNLTCHTMIIYGKVYMKEVWGGETFKPSWDGNIPALLAQNGIKTGYLVTVDYHD